MTKFAKLKCWILHFPAVNDKNDTAPTIPYHFITIQDVLEVAAYNGPKFTSIHKINFSFDQEASIAIKNFRWIKKKFKMLLASDSNRNKHMYRKKPSFSKGLRTLIFYLMWF